MAGYIGTQAVSVNTTSATISDDLAVGDDATITGDLDVDGTTNLDVVDIDGAVDMASTLAVAGVVTANSGVKVDNITIDGTEIDLSSGNLTIDVAGQLVINSDAGQIVIQDGGVNVGELANSSSDFVIASLTQDKDILFKGNDGGSTITALTLDMSAAGLAIFNAGIALGGSGAANTMDDYEEGAVSLKMKGGNGDPSTQVNVTGTYVKIGRLVSIRAQNLNLNNTGAAGSMFFEGLPFAANGAYGIGNIGEVNDICSFTNQPFIVCSGTLAYVYQNITQANASAVSHHVDTAGAINLSVTYETNS